MIQTILCLLLIVIPLISHADEYVQGYVRKDGTYVQGYNRSDSNDSVRDNYSYKGNTNPYSGEEGKNYYRNDSSSEYYQTKPSHKFDRQE